MSGWVRLSKDIMHHPMFDGDVFSRRDAWTWLITKAAWKDTKHRIKNNVYPVPRGSLFCTLRELMREWRWDSDFKVRSFLKALEKERMISKKSTQGKTHITICNYSLYQDVPQAENARPTHGQRTANALKEQDNNNNKGNRPTKGFGFSKGDFGSVAEKLKEELKEKKYG